MNRLLGMTIAQAILIVMMCVKPTFGDVANWWIAYDNVAAIEDRQVEPIRPRGSFPRDGTIEFSFLTAPESALIDKGSGVITWAKPKEGWNRFIINAKGPSGFLRKMLFNVITVKNDIPDVRMVRSKYYVFIVPGDLATWIETNGAGAHADAWWEYMRDIVGAEPTTPQLIKYNSSLGGWAYSGNPVQSSPVWWGSNDLDRWTLGIFIHEVAHNYNYMLECSQGVFDGNNKSYDRYIHGLCENSQTPWGIRVVSSPLNCGLTESNKKNAVALYGKWQNDKYERRKGYWEHLCNDGTIYNFQGDTYGMWAGLCQELSDTYGPEIMEYSLRLLRRDWASEDVFAKADTDAKKMSVLFGIYSGYSRINLTQYFRTWGFDVDQDLLTETMMLVAEKIKSRQIEDKNGWKKSPINGHYYRLTNSEMFRMQASDYAKSVRGHLAIVTTSQEQVWIESRFGTENIFWIGGSDSKNENTWKWDNGESLNYKCWGPGEPNGGTRENYIAIRIPNRKTHNSYWWDVDDTVPHRALIEVDAPGPISGLVTDLILNKDNMSRNIGDSEKLVATIVPSDASNKTLTWSSSNSAVATVEQNGLVAFIGEGVCIVSATTADGIYTAACQIVSGKGTSNVTVNQAMDQADPTNTSQDGKVKN